jgi:hypothetical protein
MIAREIVTPTPAELANAAPRIAQRPASRPGVLFFFQARSGRKASDEFALTDSSAR